MDFTECYQDTCSAVGLAARAGDARRVQRLLKRGYSADVKDNRGWNALHEAAASGSTDCVRLLTTPSKFVSCRVFVSVEMLSTASRVYSQFYLSCVLSKWNLSLTGVHC